MTSQSPAQPVDSFLDDVLGDFLDESDELLGRLNEDLLELDQWANSHAGDDSSRCDENLLNNMFRAAHTFKGLSGMLGFTDIMGLTHTVENVFDAARDDKLRIDGDVVELIFRAVDHLSAMIAGIKDENADAVDAEPLLRDIEKLLQQSGAERKQTSQKDAEGILDALTFDKAPCGVDQENEIQQRPLSSTESDTPAQPTSERDSADESLQSEASASEASASEVLAQRGKSADLSTNLAVSRSTNSDESVSGKPAQTMRVDIERLDQLMNQSGELVVNRARFVQVCDRLKGIAADKRARRPLENAKSTVDRLLRETQPAADRIGDDEGASSGKLDLCQIVRSLHQLQGDLDFIGRDFQRTDGLSSSLNDLFHAVHDLERVSDSIQKTVMETRMVAIGPLFARFKRVVRDISRSSGKEMDLVTLGENTELDKRMIDELSDPLIHMVRNSADHGIESPEERERAGKPRRGSVTLNALQRGNSILIQVSDDGRGLDAAKLRAKAVEKGIVSASDAEKLTDRQAFQLIWAPGFSTAEQVTSVSGRGMGMDIVRSKIENLNGTLELDSRLGEGTTVTIKLPLTLAILPSLIVQIDGDVFAIPVESVVEIVRVDNENSPTVLGIDIACVRDKVVSLVHLTQLFHWSDRPGDDSVQEKEAAAVVIVSSEGQQIGLIVHDLLGEENVVIKPLSESLRNVRGVAGAHILGNGRVSLILDIVAIVQMAVSEEPQP